MTIRLSCPADIPAMQEVFAEAKAKMRASGNMLQWTGGYPSDEVLREDIRRGFSYVVERDGRVVATFVLALCPDPTYSRIDGGRWLDDSRPYGTIHRIASRASEKKVLQTVLAFAAQKINNIRIDTHRDNAIMRHLMEVHGFTYCGIIYLANGDERMAYQRLS